MKRPNLLQYSTMAASFLLMSNAKSQAIYTDIDPDMILDADGEYGTVDMDNDGTLDFAFLNTTGTIFTTDSDPQSYVERVWAGPYISQNAIAGYENYHSGYGGYTVFYPYALSLGQAIEPKAFDFNNAGYQLMAYRTFYSTTWFSGTWEGGYWYPEVLDHYLAVRFIDSLDCYHYGWIRCDVKDEGRTLVIKDYAYETKCDVGILAGDTVGDTATVVENEVSGIEAQVYSYNSDIYILLQVIKGTYDVRILNMQGQIVYQSQLKDIYTKLSLPNLALGNYLVEVKSETRKVIKKVHLQ